MNSELYERLDRLSDQKLINICTIDRTDYKPEAIEIAEAILNKRKVNKSEIHIVKNYSECPNCGKPINSNFIGISNQILPKNKIQKINSFTNSDKEAYCNNCGDSVLRKIEEQRNNDQGITKERLENLLPSIPIITIHNPFVWEYEVKGIVTAQTTIGTGVLTEISSSFTDFFGTSSGRINSKLVRGEEDCKKLIRYKALSMGANAIIGTDMDYNEVGGDKGILLVCMAGTAVKLNNVEIMGETIKNEMEEIMSIVNALKN